jgi:hypothetical protein
MAECSCCCNPHASYMGKDTGAGRSAMLKGGLSVKKQVIYMHKGKQINQVVDTDGGVAIPNENDVVELDGKKYRALTGPQVTAGPAGALPVYTVYLEEIGSAA